MISSVCSFPNLQHKHTCNVHTACTCGVLQQYIRYFQLLFVYVVHFCLCSPTAVLCVSGIFQIAGVQSPFNQHVLPDITFVTYQNNNLPSVT